MKKQGFSRLVFNYWLLIIIPLIILTVYCLWLLRPRPVASPNLEGNKAESTTNNSAKTVSQPTEYFASFSDLFSGTAWLDKNQTSLVRDSSAMVFTFKPNLQLTNLGSCLDLDNQCQLVDNWLDIDRSCIGDKCLKIKDGQLIYQQKRLALPTNNQAKLLNLSVSLLEDRWFIGGVQRLAEKEYQPLAWLFDGQKFTAINLLNSNNQPAQSQYLGYLVAGGRVDSFLVLYSAYDGLAWQFKGSEMRSLNHFFGIRVNAGGFRPKIIYTGQGRDTTWYVFNQANQPVRWLKFWQNGTDWIEGALDLSNQLPIDSQSVYLSVNSSKNNLQAKIINGQGQAYFWSINDLGFISPNDSQVVSVNLTSYDQVKPKIIGATIANALGGWSGFNQKWSLSIDGQHWQAVNIGERFNFSKPAEQLWWRWQVSPPINQWQSPCLKMITLNYFRL